MSGGEYSLDKALADYDQLKGAGTGLPEFNDWTDAHTWVAHLDSDKRSLFRAAIDSRRFAYFYQFDYLNNDAWNVEGIEEVAQLIGQLNAPSDRRLSNIPYTDRGFMLVCAWVEFQTSVRSGQPEPHSVIGTTGSTLRRGIEEAFPSKLAEIEQLWQRVLRLHEWSYGRRFVVISAGISWLSFLPYVAVVSLLVALLGPFVSVVSLSAVVPLRVGMNRAAERISSSWGRELKDGTVLAPYRRLRAKREVWFTTPRQHVVGSTAVLLGCLPYGVLALLSSADLVPGLRFVFLVVFALLTVIACLEGSWVAERMRPVPMSTANWF
ncbi:MAG: hypothetical protein GY788_08090 [bacterium]|nr:hypothetical protein [bacterium]